MKRAIIIFTRVPVAGKTKTRMMPYLSPAACAKLHTCFLRDIADECRRCKADVFVSYTPNNESAAIRNILDNNWTYFFQAGNTLGERMQNAMSRVLEQGYDSCVLIGTDVPELRVKCLDKAFSVLQKNEVVFGRTTDGGYYLIGMNRLIEDAFSLERYGHAEVLKETVRRLEDRHIKVGYTDTLSDMDTVEDLRGYRKRMCTDLYLKNTFTGRYLARNSKISIIVPVYNEEKTIKKLQLQLKPYLGRCEILLVDGGSTDKTLELIEPGFTVLHSPKSRAVQMNYGAEKSSGDILFFLHCDSEVPDHLLQRIRKVMRDHQAGCFGIAFHSRNFFMFTCRVISNHRVKDRKVMFGDQGIFIERQLFFEAGMYPEIPVMEDYQLSLTLKNMGIKLGMADKRIYTSDRRFPKGTIPKLKLMWKMNRLRKMYRDGVPIQCIDEMYRDVR